MNIIPPELLAGKLESDADFFRFVPPERVSHYRELLWFLQALSMQPRGLQNLSADLAAQFPDKFISKAMAAAGLPANGKNYDLAQCLEIWKTCLDRHNPFARAPEISPLELCSLNGYSQDARQETRPRDPSSFPDWLAANIDQNISVETLKSPSYDKAAILQGCKRFNYEFLNGECLKQSEHGLEQWIFDLCTHKHHALSPPWYCVNLFDLLLDYMGRVAASGRASIAETEVTKIVFRNLEFAWSQNVPVPIVGESRIGKTSPAAAWCAMRPGRARLVTVPESNRYRDFIEAHADAFGIEYTPGSTTAALASAVKYVHQHSGLFICYDESQFLIPVNYNKSTPPARLNFVRCQVIDRDLGCAFFATPQTYKQSLDQYAKTTGYRMEQWLGRLAPAVVLPSDLGREDLLAVAKLHFPDMPELYLELIGASAMKSEGYLKNMEITAKWARFIAAENGHKRPTLEDVKAAIAQMNPQSAAAPQPMAKTAKAKSPADTDERPGPTEHVHRQAFREPAAKRATVPEFAAI